MSLGGHMYAGHSVQKSDFTNLTDKQWALALHKCRVKAFVDSVARSGATWVCSRTNGEIDLDSTCTGYIHILAESSGASDDTYQGYATYFKYMDNGTATAYFLIFTAPRWQINDFTGDSSSANGGVDIYANNVYTDHIDSSGNKWTLYSDRTTCFYALSLDEFGSHPKDDDYIPVRATRLTSCGAIVYHSVSSSPYPRTLSASTNTFMGSNSVSFGYCTKSGTPDVIEFAKNLNDLNLNWNVNVISPIAMSQNISPNDSYKLASIKLRSNNVNYSTGSSGEIYSTGLYAYASYLNYLNSGGSLCWGYYSSSISTIVPNVRLCFNYIPTGSSLNDRIYSAFVLSTEQPTGTDNEAKGFVNIELAAFSYESSNDFQATSGGNYLCVGNKTVAKAYFTSSSSTATIYAFVGWDASNPDMTTINACPVYVPDVSFPA